MAQQGNHAPVEQKNWLKEWFPIAWPVFTALLLAGGLIQGLRSSSEHLSEVIGIHLNHIFQRFGKLEEGVEKLGKEDKEVNDAISALRVEIARERVDRALVECEARRWREEMTSVKRDIQEIRNSIYTLQREVPVRPRNDGGLQ